MLSPNSIIKAFHVTEKTAALTQANQYTFLVYPGVNRIQVRQAIEALYPQVKVASVNIINRPGKPKPNRFRRGRVNYTSVQRKAVVKLKEGQIQLA
jgi:large subunit ribosomal protein L23